MAEAAIFYTHVNRNRVRGTEPAVRFQKGKYGKPTYCFEVELPAGARMIHSPDVPLLPCGARLVIVSDQQPKVIR